MLTKPTLCRSYEKEALVKSRINTVAAQPPIFALARSPPVLTHDKDFLITMCLPPTIVAPQLPPLCTVEQDKPC